MGLIGYSIGRAHAHAWSSLNEYLYPSLKATPQLVALCGRDKERVEYEARHYGFKRTYSEWEKLIRDEDVTVVDNCAPPSLHLDPILAAAESGKDVVCEKPLARNASEARAMLKAVQKARVKHMVGYNYRFLPAVALTHQMIRDGELGTIYYFKGSYLNVNEDYDDPDSPLRWQQNSDVAGHGALSDLGTHAIDLGRFLVGELASVSGAESTFVNQRPLERNSTSKGKVTVDDITIACLKFRNGALGILETSWLTSGRTDYLAFEIYGSLGSVRFNLERMNELEVFMRNGDAVGKQKKVNGVRNVMVLNREHPFMQHFWPNQSTGFGWEHTFVGELGHFAKSIEGDSSVEPLGATFLDGYRNCVVMDSIIESSRSGRWVDIPTD